MTQTHEAENFAPIVDINAKILILGSMPGIASLEAQHYYAHPRNGFWPIIGSLLKVTWPENFDARYALLKQHHIALWDVMKSCRRTGSLDQNIEEASIIANDFDTFLTQHMHITDIFFNGQKAAQSFKKYALPNLSEQVIKRVQFHTLPSSSPAMASLNIAAKTEKWRIIQDILKP